VLIKREEISISEEKDTGAQNVEAYLFGVVYCFGSG